MTPRPIISEEISTESVDIVNVFNLFNQEEQKEEPEKPIPLTIFNRPAQDKSPRAMETPKFANKKAYPIFTVKSK